MERTVFITEKSLAMSSALSFKARSLGRNVAITNSTQINPFLLDSVKKNAQTSSTTALSTTPSSMTMEQESETKIINPIGTKNLDVLWNRNSASGTRAAILEVERNFKRIDEAFLVFDSIAFHEHYQDISPAGCTKAIDDLIAGYLFMACELLQRFKREKQGKLVFIVREKKPEILNIQLAMAQAAFIGLAEETATSSLSLPWDVFLIKAEDSSDEEFASWVFSTIDDSSKKPSSRWLKMSSRGGFFGRF